MKKLTKILLTFCFLFSSIGTFTFNNIKAATYNLSVVMKPSKTNPKPGEKFTMTMTLKNNDSQAFTAVAVSDDLISYTTYGSIGVICTPNDSTCDGTSWLGANNIALNPGETKSFSHTYQVKSDVQPGKVITSSGTVVSVNGQHQSQILSKWTITVGTTATPTQSPTKTPTKTPSPTKTTSPTTTVKTTATPTPSTSISPTPTTTDSKSALPNVYLQTGSKTTDISKLTSEELETVENFTLDDPKNNMIEFLEPVNLSEVEKLKDSVDVSAAAKVKIDSTDLPGLNKKSKITMRNLKFTTTPKILRDGKDSSDYVSDIKYDFSTGILTFNVKGFSTYEAVENQPESSLIKDKKSKTTVIIVAGITFVILSAALVYWYFKKRKNKSTNEVVASEKTEL